MFKTNPLRTWLTIMGMGVGVGAVVVLVGLGFGLQQIILEQIVFGDSLLSLGVSSTGSQGPKLTPETVQQFERNEAVVDAAPLARFPALVTYQGLTGNVFVQGVEPPYLRFAGITASYGDVFLEEDIADTSSVMLSPATIKLFGIPDEEAEAFIGEKVSLRLLVPADDGTENVNEIIIDKEYTVRGITKEDLSNINCSDISPNLRRPVLRRLGPPEVGLQYACTN
jgi:ABC-type antimicrobial peptide transport system permease subunit